MNSRRVKALLHRFVGVLVVGWYVGEFGVDRVGQRVGFALVAVAQFAGSRELAQLHEGSLERFVAEPVPAGEYFAAQCFCSTDLGRRH